MEVHAELSVTPAVVLASSEVAGSVMSSSLPTSDRVLFLLILGVSLVSLGVAECSPGQRLLIADLLSLEADLSLALLAGVRHKSS